MANVTEAIILNSIKYSETSVIMKCYSQNYGILSFIIKGVRSRKRTKFSLGSIEPLSIVEIEFNRLKNGEMKLIGFFMGQIMKQAKGKANPQSVQKIINKYITDQK